MVGDRLAQELDAIKEFEPDTRDAWASIVEDLPFPCEVTSHANLVANFGVQIQGP